MNAIVIVNYLANSFIYFENYMNKAIGVMCASNGLNQLIFRT